MTYLTQVMGLGLGGIPYVSLYLSCQDVSVSRRYQAQFMLPHYHTVSLIM